MKDDLVTATWLFDHLHQPDLVILESSLDKTRTSCLESIPNARYFDLKNIFSNTESEFPNTFPSNEQFEAQCRKLGINQDSHLVIYDRKGVYSSPRVWFMFKMMGHSLVSILDGGLPEWNRLGFHTTTLSEKFYSEGDFVIIPDISSIKCYEEILSNVASSNFQLVDARSSGRFLGTEPEPRQHLQSGHMANAINIPFTEILQSGKFKSKEDLVKVFEAKLNTQKDLVFSCGSGVTACIVLFASRLVLVNKTFLYDGSWSEWAVKQGLIIK